MYDACCGPLHSGTTQALTAEQLMRSRYSAFALGDTDYLLRTWHDSTRPDEIVLDPSVSWYRLDVLATHAGSPFDTTGTVEFEAFRKGPGGGGSQHEVSAFVREDGAWFYLDGHS